jgi:phosphoglucomutase
MVSDPDADRVGLAYLDTQGNYQRLNGNLSGALLANYLFSQLRETGKMPINPIMYDTIVCSPFARQIASSYGVHVESFLTGFKFIGDRIQFYEQNAGPTFVFGYEESYGCLIGSFVRDKDALQALLMYAEMTLFYLTQGKRLNQVIDELFQSFGYHEDAQFSVALQGEEGQTFLSNLMQAIRSKPFQAIGSRNVVQFEDYFHQQKKTKDNQIFPIHLPQANVVKITYDDQSTVVIRPSGTEPKCKFYVSIVEKTPTNLLEKIEQLKHDFYAFYSINDR